MTSPEIPKTQKAALYDKPGTLSIKVSEIETPEPQAGQVLVKLTHSGVCHSDYGVMTNSWKWLPAPTEPGQVGGHEGVGEIVKLGPGVDDGVVKIGDRMLLFSFFFSFLPIVSLALLLWRWQYRKEVPKFPGLLTYIILDRCGRQMGISSLSPLPSLPRRRRRLLLQRKNLRLLHSRNISTIHPRTSKLRNTHPRQCPLRRRRPPPLWRCNSILRSKEIPRATR